MVDYRGRIRALRALGAEGSGATEAERKLANERADQLERDHPEAAERVTESSPFTDHTTTTEREEAFYDFFIRRGSAGKSYYYYDRGPRTGHGSNMPPPNNGDFRPKGPTPEQSWRDLQDLLRNQWKWNDKYYDKDGKPRTHVDDSTIVDEDYAYEPPGEDEDWGYKIYEEEDYE